MRSRWTHVAAAWLAAASLCASGCQAEPPASDRTVTLDLARDIAALGSDDLFVSDPALDRIVAIGEPTVPVLVRAFRDEPPAVRTGILEALKQIGGRDASDAILAAARDPDSTVRYDALLVLGGLEDARARTAVEGALDDPEPQVQLAAASACASLCASQEATERLVELAIHDAAVATAIAARASLIAMLSDAGPRAATAAGAIRAEALGVMTGTGDLRRRARAALLAADAGEVAAAPILIEAATKLDDARIGHRAVYALGDVGNADAVPVAVAALDGPFAPYGYDALRRMAARGVPGAQDALAGYDGPRPPGPLPPP